MPPNRSKSRAMTNQTNGIKLADVQTGDELMIHVGHDRLKVKVQVTADKITAQAMGVIIPIARRRNDVMTPVPRMYIDAHQPSIFES